MEPWHKKFIEQVKYNKEYAKNKVINDADWRSMVWLLCWSEGNTQILYDPNDLNDCWTEFIEFIDGNGFKVTDKKQVTEKCWRVIVEYERNG